ncbi:Predicted amino acid racemase [Anaerobranca californiensis DSM 14826]|jgi:predicted amino acid racemase|uniref:Predicted amino acid racemase n=1 Tax=Anaerobranca californiensis DSM 14826 TaxID=1120989 RepID=A0A1M6MY97_9FIRM|nr:alanine/ornithine racemase family PLP-dependent enzyme [Anaerobranca californiensis]SHJ88419.1 Predicted amino acid racemase [Anaerobranca californiensis DSM 14826]
MYPKIEINLRKIKDNGEVLLKLCREKGIEPCAVTKGTCADLEVAKAFVQAGFKELADSRMENIKKLKGYFKDSIKTLLLRIPMVSECEEVVDYCDTSLNSELITIKKLNEVAGRVGKKHKIIIMVDLGDLREGIWPTDLESIQREVENLENIQVVGLGTNLTCYGGIIPSEKNLAQLCDLKRQWELRGGTPLQIISGGNSSSIKMLMEGKIPQGINHLRLGESLLLGRETINREHIPKTHLDTFKIVGEIVELKEKPSVPIGEIGQDAFGNVPTFEDRGIHKRAIVALGRQDIDLNMEPLNKEIEILGGSSDHLLLDVTKLPDLKVGDKVEFLPNYGALLQGMTSPYVQKEYIGKE